MSNLEEIATRHGRDRWKDVLFIGIATLVTAVSIGSIGSFRLNAIGMSSSPHAWNVTVIENPSLLH